MTAYTTITDAETDPEAPLTSILAKKWRDNPIAITEGSSGAPKIQDAALDSTVTTAGTTWVNARIAGSSNGSIGTYALLSNQSTAANNITAGTNIAGSSLRYTSASGNNSGTPAGTWKSMGYHQTDTTSNIPAVSPQRVTLFVRVS